LLFRPPLQILEADEMKHHRHGVLLAGGGGTRLWPASLRSRPKQFLPLGHREGEPLIAGAARRLSQVCGERLLVVTAADQAAQVKATLPTLPDGDILGEPAARNTAAAIGLAATYAAHRDPHALVGAVPADQDIADEAGFTALAERAFELAAQKDAIVLLGVVPTRPETGFGYLELGASLEGGAREVARFVEKPDTATAARYAASGSHLWNAGMFFAPARLLLEAIARHLPQLGAALDAIAEALREGGEAAAAARAVEVYTRLPSISIDHGVMEKVSGAIALPADIGWNDVGSWSALADTRSADEHGNITEGRAILIDARRNIVVGDGEHAVAVVGLDDVVVVQSGRGILVIPRERAQDVRRVVAELEARGLSEFLDEP
jgi:mannose-1-phosphate guanylyltransferase